MEVYINNERKIPKSLKVAVIRQEFVDLTGDFVMALILAQFDYLQLRTKDTDEYIREERERLRNAGIEPGAVEETHGWIYKSADQLTEEIMVGQSPRSVRNKINGLVEKGWLQRRRNPKFGYDRTYQYRLNLFKIKQDLEALGYPSACWTVQPKNSMLAYWVSIIAREEQENTCDSPNDDERITHVEESAPSIGTEFRSNGSGIRAIPETTTETLKKEISKEKDFEGTVREEHVKADSSSSRSPKNETLQSWPVGTPPDVLKRRGDQNFGTVAAELLSAKIVEVHGPEEELTPAQLTSYRKQFNKAASEGYESDVLSRVAQHIAAIWKDYLVELKVKKSIPYSEMAYKRQSQRPQYGDDPTKRKI